MQAIFIERSKYANGGYILGNHTEEEEPPMNPVPRAGREKGLTLVLDAHTDMVAANSINADVDGFLASVDASSKYPLTHKKSVWIRPGHSNMVALRATRIKAGFFTPDTFLNWEKL